jgi:hypothetical protein
MPVSFPLIMARSLDPSADDPPAEDKGVPSLSHVFGRWSDEAWAAKMKKLRDHHAAVRNRERERLAAKGITPTGDIGNWLSDWPTPPTGSR